MMKNNAAPNWCIRCGKEIPMGYKPVCLSCAKHQIVRRCPKCDTKMIAKEKAQGRHIIEYYRCEACGYEQIINKFEVKP